MIRKRPEKSVFEEEKIETKLVEIKQESSKNENSAKPIKDEKLKTFDNKNRKIFKTYREEAIYIINLLKSQGIDIYDKNRYGGMYLHGNNSAKISQIFDVKDNVEKKENNLSQSELSKIFNS